MANTAFANKLKKLKSNWKNASSAVEKGRSDFEQLEPGRYTGKITDAEVNESQAGRLQCFLELTVTEGEHASETIRKYYGLDREESLTFLQRDLVRLGVEVPEDPEELESALGKIVKANIQLKFRVKEKGEYLNVYFDKVLGAEGNGEAEGEEEDDNQDVGKNAKGKKSSKSEDEEEEKEEKSEEGDDDEVSIEVGLRVEVKDKGVGVIKEVDEDEGQITVKLETGKTVVVGVDALTLAPEPKPTKPTLRVKRK